MFVSLNKLPGPIGAALHVAGASPKRDLDIQAKERAYACTGGKGTRAWLVVLPRLDSPEGIKRYTGEFGGPTPFTKCALDDYARDGIDVPEDGAILTGVGTYSVCYVRPTTLAKLLAPEHPATMVAVDAVLSENPNASLLANEALSSIEKHGVSNAIRYTLFPFKGLKPAYRKEALRELAIKTDNAAGTPELVQRCIELGYLSVNRAGATSITTEGKNLCKEAPYNVTRALCLEVL